MTYNLTIKNQPGPFTVKVARQEDGGEPQVLAILHPGEETTVAGWASNQIVIREVLATPEGAYHG